MKPLTTHGGRALAVLITVCAACDGESSSAPGATPAAALRCEAPREVPCTDQSVAQLRLFSAPNPGAVSSRALGGGVFESSIDASAGGVSATMSFVYVRFGTGGLEKVDIGDEAAFRSMDWDVALRRFSIRVNGGSSGPSCVEAAFTDKKLDDVGTMSTPLGFETDNFLEPPSCMLKSEPGGVGGPVTAISGFYDYRECLEMTLNAFVIRLRDGRHVALEVTQYYPKAVQDACNATGMLPSGPSNGGNYVLRWKYVATPGSTQ